MCWILELSSVIRANHIHLSVHTVPCIRTHLRTSWTHVSTKAKTPTLEISHRRTLARNSSVAETTVQKKYARINDRSSMMSMMDPIEAVSLNSLSYSQESPERNLRKYRRNVVAILAWTQTQQSLRLVCSSFLECYFSSGQKAFEANDGLYRAVNTVISREANRYRLITAWSALDTWSRYVCFLLLGGSPTYMATSRRLRPQLFLGQLIRARTV